jgi:hypothetical protein
MILTQSLKILGLKCERETNYMFKGYRTVYLRHKNGEKNEVIEYDIITSPSWSSWNGKRSASRIEIAAKVIVGFAWRL